MDLTCMDQNQINLIYVLFCAGCILQGFLFSDLPDKWGYRATNKVVGTINLEAQITILVVPQYHVRALCFFVMGLC
jgi:hypothetical protein